MLRASEFILNFVLNACWQIAAVFVVAALASWLLKNGPARYRHTLWTVALEVEVEPLVVVGARPPVEIAVVPVLVSAVVPVVDEVVVDVVVPVVEPVVDPPMENTKARTCLLELARVPLLFR